MHNGLGSDDLTCTIECAIKVRAHAVSRPVLLFRWHRKCNCVRPGLCPWVRHAINQSKSHFPVVQGSKTDVCYVGQVSYRETGMKEDTVSDVRQEMAERHQAGCLTMGGRTERKDTGRHSHANWTGKNHAATLSCDYAIVTTKSNQSTRVLKKSVIWVKKKNATDCNCSIYFSTLYHGCQHTPFSCNRPLRLALVLHTGVWQKSSASSSGNPQPVP